MVFIIFNLVLAILVNNFQVANDEQELREEHEELNKVNSLDELIADDSENETSDDEVSFLHKKWRKNIIQYGDPVARKTIETEAAEMKKILAERLNEKLKRSANDGEFNQSFAHLSESEYKLTEWYYRLLPAIERQHFLYDNQFNALMVMVDDAIDESEEVL